MWYYTMCSENIITSCHLTYMLIWCLIYMFIYFLIFCLYERVEAYWVQEMIEKVLRIDLSVDQIKRFRMRSSDMQMKRHIERSWDLKRDLQCDVFWSIECWLKKKIFKKLKQFIISKNLSSHDFSCMACARYNAHFSLRYFRFFYIIDNHYLAII